MPSGLSFCVGDNNVVGTSVTIRKKKKNSYSGHFLPSSQTPE